MFCYLRIKHYKTKKNPTLEWEGSVHFMIKHNVFEEHNEFKF